MKRLFILFVVLCLAVSAVALASCGGNGDTDTNTDKDTDTSTNTSTDAGTDNNTDTDTKEEIEYSITIKDQEEAFVADAKVFIVDEFEQIVATLTTDESGKVSVKLVKGEYYAKFELPEYHLYSQGVVKLENGDISVVVTNNTPNGTEARPYPLTDNNDIKLGANQTVYYAAYGGGRNILIENAQGLKFTYEGEEPLEADEENKIYFKMPVIDDTNTNDRGRTVKLENTTDEEKSYVLTIYSDKGASDNPYDVVLDEDVEITVMKGSTVYYRYVAQKSGMVVVYCETEKNNISCYNIKTNAATEFSNGEICSYIYANQGDEIQIRVASNADKNYNKVKFKTSHYAGTEEEPIPLYKNDNVFKLAKSQELCFVAGVGVESKLNVSGDSYKLTIDGNEYTNLTAEEVLVEDGKLFKVANTDAYDPQNVTISFTAVEDENPQE